jgi:hypothetical protein
MCETILFDRNEFINIVMITGVLLFYIRIVLHMLRVAARTHSLFASFCSLLFTFVHFCSLLFTFVVQNWAVRSSFCVVAQSPLYTIFLRNRSAGMNALD